MLPCIISTVPAGFTSAAAEIPAAGQKFTQGTQYTESPTFVQKLNTIRNGACGLYANASKASTGQNLAVGSRLNVNYKYYAVTPSGNQSWYGWQCFIYSQGVYGQLFDELPLSGGGGYNHSRVAIRNVSSVSADLFKANRIMPGAYVRTTSNADGSYSSSYGHSLIILGYSDWSITMLEGNADNNGLIREQTISYADFNRAYLTSCGRKICHIV